MLLVPSGNFVMGDKQGKIDEKQHQVYLDSFYMDKYLVTQEEYEKIIGENPSKWNGPKNPVDQMRWADAVRYCNARSKLEGLKPCYDLQTWECNFNANGYRLPTEAEWEYAARAQTQTSYFFGRDAQKLASYAWFKKNSDGKSHPVGEKLPNPWGFFDMYGNLWQWCNDYYDPEYYEKSVLKNPRGPSTGNTRVLRGGCWDSSADKCRSSYRYNENPACTDVCFGYDIYGFRCVRKK